mgnify:CR=1 FL=1
MASYNTLMSATTTTKGDILCKSKAEMAEIIKQGAALPQGDEIWMNSSENMYPCLSVLVKGQYACVHYFENDEGRAWQSCGDFDREVTFLAGCEAWEAPDYVIIPLEKAVDCMEEFWDTLERPKCIQWEALWEEG